jgi:NAD(P)-dependent dehydrogenase (short-subunit alcohol dehydrogenase family)
MSITRYGCLAGRVVLITGGASGIGAAFVRAVFGVPVGSGARPSRT